MTKRFLSAQILRALVVNHLIKIVSQQIFPQQKGEKKIERKAKRSKIKKINLVSSSKKRASALVQIAHSLIQQLRNKNRVPLTLLLKNVKEVVLKTIEMQIQWYLWMVWQKKSC